MLISRQAQGVEEKEVGGPPSAAPHPPRASLVLHHGSSFAVVASQRDWCHGTTVARRRPLALTAPGQATAVV